MTCTELYKLMENPENLSERTLSDLREIVVDYPYFHAARMLYLKNLAQLDDLRLQVELKKMAIHIPDRVQLYWLIEGGSLTSFENEAKQEVNPLPKFDLVESYLDTNENVEEKEIDKTILFEPVAASDYMNWLMSDSKKADVASPQLQHQELIDSFLDKDAEKGTSRLQLTPLSYDSREDQESSEIMNDSDNEILDSSYFTETLAHVYVKQKRFDKALEIIRNLSLKYPEKNIYFADQIRFLEKLIVHTKS